MDTYEVLPMTTDLTSQTVEANGKKYPWGRSGAFHVKSQGEAEALQAKYGHKLLVDKVSIPHPSDRGHKYSFQVPELPWKKEGKDGGKRTENSIDPGNGSTPGG